MLPIHSSFVIGFAGIALFMLGMRMASENLQKLAANHIRDLIGSLAKKPYLGVLLGGIGSIEFHHVPRHGLFQ